MSGIIKSKRHGHKKGGATSMYDRWQNMRRRCSNPKHAQYPNYGARGIKVCERWDKSFLDFLTDITATIGLPPTPKHTLDRTDNDGNYEPGNVRWATMAEQNRNSRHVHLITFKGKTQCLTAWAQELGIPRSCLDRRINGFGWSVERAFTKPYSPGRNPLNGQFS
jgi:hypothetical protein